MPFEAFGKAIVRCGEKVFSFKRKAKDDCEKIINCIICKINTNLIQHYNMHTYSILYFRNTCSIFFNDKYFIQLFFSFTGDSRTAEFIEEQTKNGFLEFYRCTTAVEMNERYFKRLLTKQKHNQEKRWERDLLSLIHPDNAISIEYAQFFKIKC